MMNMMEEEVGGGTTPSISSGVSPSYFLLTRPQEPLGASHQVLPTSEELLPV